MKGLIQASLGNPYAVIVMSLTIAILGSIALLSIPVDILPEIGRASCRERV